MPVAGGVPWTPGDAYAEGMPEEPEFYVECHTAGEAGRALGRGYAAIATAAKCAAEPPCARRGPGRGLLQACRGRADRADRARHGSLNRGLEAGREVALVQRQDRQALPGRQLGLAGEHREPARLLRRALGDVQASQGARRAGAARPEGLRDSLLAVPGQQARPEQRGQAAARQQGPATRRPSESSRGRAR